MDLVVGAVSAALTVIGFVAIWLKVGIIQGRQDKTLEVIEKRLARNEGDVETLKSKTESIQLEIARSVGKIEAKLDYISESVAALKGARRAAQK